VKNDMAHYKNPSLDVDSYIAGLREAGMPATAEYLNQTRVLLVS
jgi:hypothetical protein